MKKLDAIPKEVLEHIQSEHERALSKILTKDTAIAKLPVRPVQMRILRPGQNNSTIETVIAPPVHVYVPKSGIIDGNLLTTRDIRYVLPYTGQPFPYGHIFNSSGYICLGSIFVPSTVSIYNPQQPLETLFLHNDRNTGHGGASIKINKGIIEKVIEALEFYNLELTSDAERTLISGQNILRNDALWILSADILKQTSDTLFATDVMNRLYQIIFRVSQDKKGE